MLLRMLGLLFFFICGVNAKENANEIISSKNSDGFCDKKTESCEGNAADNSKQFISFEPSSPRMRFKDIAREYAAWHNQTLYNGNIPCDEKLALVFEPNAGLGDSIGALTSAFSYALRSGRLFFIDWKPYPWSVGFHKLPFLSSYNDASKLTDKHGQRLLCVDTSISEFIMQGHPTADHPLVQASMRADYDLSGIFHYFIQPSNKVIEIVANFTKHHYQTQNDVKVHKVAIVIRTGEGEYNQFLSKGDEKNFVKCFRSYIDDYVAKHELKKKKTLFKVLVTSDNEHAKQNAVQGLKDLDDNSDHFQVTPLTLKDSTVHVMHLNEKEQKLKKNRAKLRKTYAEFFLIGQCDVRFLTHGSLFGKVAADECAENTNFYISDSKCDGKREKYSYLQCHNPKYPAFCAEFL